MEVFYTKEHEWINLDNNTGTVGITSYAAEQLGDITFVELPAVGKKVNQFDPVCAIESVKAASDIYAPLSGEVLEVNSDLDNAPDIINESAEKKGWLLKMNITDLAGTSKLMQKNEYDEYVKGLCK